MTECAYKWININNFKHFYFSAINGTYDASTCLSVTNGICPSESKKNNRYCPCISTTSTTVCEDCNIQVNSNSDLNINDNGCGTYEALSIGTCYCKNQFNRILIKGDYMDLYNTLKDETNKCKKFTNDYLLANGLVYAIIIFTVLLNMLLKRVLDKLTQFELHASIDKSQGSLLFKLFVATYLNMAFTALIAYGFIPGMPYGLQSVYIFQG